jgi:hypothetical protein
MGTLVFDAEVREASCPCGLTVIPRAFMLYAGAH